MWLNYLLVGLLIFISGLSKAIQDKIQFHFYESKFRKLGNFWNPEESWKRKYKDNDPKKGEWFLGSSTIFVSFTDAWHLFGLIRNFSLILALSVASNNWWFLLGYIIFIMTFHIFYTWAFKSTK